MKITLIVAIVCSFVIITFAQNPKNTKSKFLIDAKKPAVSISFLRSEEIQSDSNDDEKSYLFFQITNNTHWSVFFDMGGAAKKELGDARLFYAIEEVKNGKRCKKL